MNKKPTRQEITEINVVQQAQVQAPFGAPQMAPTQFAPSVAGPMLAGPSTVAPVRRVVHPTRVVERHSVTRYPIENIYPTHVKNVRHHVCEYFCEYPVSESVEDCFHSVDHCCPPPSFRR